MILSFWIFSRLLVVSTEVEQHSNSLLSSSMTSRTSNDSLILDFLSQMSNKWPSGPVMIVTYLFSHQSYWVLCMWIISCAIQPLSVCIEVEQWLSFYLDLLGPMHDMISCANARQMMQNRYWCIKHQYTFFYQAHPLSIIQKYIESGLYQSYPHGMI